MSRLRIAATGLLAVSSLGAWLAPHGAAAQTAMATREYEVSITNLTSRQAFSPPLLATHPASAHVWQMGQTASDGLKLLAEEGMADTLAASLKGIATDVVVGDAPVMPGKTATFKIKAHEGDVLSAAAMLVQTNDGFTGLDNMALTSAAATRDANAYDAGVEQNTEKASDVPGPPFGGHNSGPQTGPRQPIAMHPGITGKADVGSEYNWTNPVARFSIHVSMMGEDSTMGGSQGSTAGPGASMGGTTAGTGSTMPGGMPDTGHPAQATGGDTMKKGDTMMGNEMPATGAGQDATWVLLFALAGLLLGGGFALRRLPLPRR